MNPCTFKIQPYSFTPSKKAVTLEERRIKFRKRCTKSLEEMGWGEEDFPKWLKLKWVDKWEATNENGRKMAWEMEKVFDVKARLRTFRRNSKQWDKKLWKDKKPKVKVNISKRDYDRIDYSEAKSRSGKDQAIGDILGAGERLRKNWKS